VSIIDQIAFDQIANERDKAQQENKLLKQRIKRLEEVGDKMEIYCDTILARDWKEAKEAKP
jgi:hypothetical protein